MSLSPYQYQLGGIKFGRGTEIPIQKVDLQPYNVNNQDFQVQRSDENRFGVDTLTPSPMIFTMSVLQNFELESMSGLAGPAPDDLFASGHQSINQLASVWKNTQLRMTWGATVPLLFCDKEGNIRRIYGRPGKFAHAPRHKQSEHWIDVQAEFRRSDTFAHSHIEYYVGDPSDSEQGLPPDGVTTVNAARQDGDGDSWLRFLFYGPMTHPVVQYGDNTLELSTIIPAGVVLEVSSYPWSRRVVDSNNVNRRAEVIGSTLYLDQIKFPAGSNMDISWTCSGSDANTQLLMLWREAYNVI